MKRVVTREDMARVAEGLLRGATFVAGSHMGTDEFVLTWQSGNLSCRLKVTPCPNGQLAYEFTADPPKEGRAE